MYNQILKYTTINRQFKKEVIRFCIIFFFRLAYYVWKMTEGTYLRLRNKCKPLSIYYAYLFVCFSACLWVCTRWPTQGLDQFGYGFH